MYVHVHQHRQPTLPPPVHIPPNLCNPPMPYTTQHSPYQPTPPPLPPPPAPSPPSPQPPLAGHSKSVHLISAGVYNSTFSII